MRIRPLALAVLVMATTAGCRGLGEVFRLPEIPAYATLEVWNRTTQDVFLVDSEGARLGVPACGHARLDRFRTNRVDVRTTDGYVFTFGSPGAGSDQYLVLVASGGTSPSGSPPATMPACGGRPLSQPEVTSEAP